MPVWLDVERKANDRTRQLDVRFGDQAVLAEPSPLARAVAAEAGSYTATTLENRSVGT